MQFTSIRRFGWLTEYLRSNPMISLWVLMLFIGGCILLAHQASETYLPEFTLTDLAGLIASITLIGFLLTAFFVLGCIFPTFGLRWFEKSWPLTNNQRYFGTTAAKWVLAIFPASTYVIGFLLILILDWFKYELLIGAYLIIAFLCALVFSAVLIRHELGIKLTRSLKTLECFQKGIALFFWTLLFALPIQIILIFSSTSHPKFSLLISLWFALILIMFNTGAYFAQSRDFVYICGIIAMITVILVPLFTSNAMFFPKTILQVLALGNRNVSELVLSNKQCPILARYNVECNATHENHAVVLENVNILSRVGSTVLIELLAKRDAEDHQVIASDQHPPNTLTIDPLKRPLYCGKNSNEEKYCSSCDALTLEHVQFPALSSSRQNSLAVEHYKNSLICIRLAIPKDHIVSTLYGGKRTYSGFTALYSSR